jgi:hypothetical protein
MPLLGNIMNKKVLILVLALDQEPFKTIESEGQKTTWASVPHADIQTLWLLGNTQGFLRLLNRVVNKLLYVLNLQYILTRFRNLFGSWIATFPTKLIDDALLTEVPETYLNTNAKTIAGFRYALKHLEFDFLLRTNSSTYVNKEGLADFVNSLPDTIYYGGSLRQYGEDQYVIGTSILLSRNAVELVSSDTGFEYHHVDDIAIGRSLKRAGIYPQDIAQLSVETEESLNELTPKTVHSAFLMRCKGLYDRKHDIIAMKKIHGMLGY